MISINSKILIDIHIKDKLNIDALISSRKAELLHFINNPTKIVNRKPTSIVLIGNQLAYLQELYGNFEKIVLANTFEIQNFKIVFDSIISVKLMKTTTYKEFRNELNRRLGYKDLRDNFYSEYFEKIGIKTCVYCSSQYALTVRTVNGKKCAKFQVDHYYSKSDYPCFSISFYNLYPVCGPCNNSKSTNTTNFNLYSDDFNEYKSSKFKFELDKKSLLKYRVNGINSELKLKFKEPLGSNFNSLFAIEGIYETQKDIAEELVLKSIIYNQSYTNSLKNALKKLYKDKSPMLEQLLIGNYINEADIHKRPMAKFTQDIAKQLKLL
ncbi:Uncharacterised protein [Chryseobacterium nakagawai]|uniref:HNH endonuclease n=1 Tax=Chryseobacterium nakagawai TaxID=1241982 RepID=A0AAD1DSK5_CHRNA|nr:hypothetical protein [Chryseobacterium nakagawai]AZA93617.1 hypothetical protein EG343_24925 [Chryseobacterium nakagawai]VEH20319.1 Uncharacterised protein [Chryseobacterium nakagawai]